KGSEVTAYINGDMRLLQAKFVAANAESTAASTTVPLSQSSTFGAIALQSNPDGADIYVDGQFVGDAPATLKLPAGQHTIKVSFAGYKDWSRDLSVQANSDAHLTANLEKTQVPQ